jgi:hypothetical protein
MCLAGTCQSGSSDGGFNLSCPSPGTFASCPNSPCGTERWSIKTTTDSAAPQISTNVQTTTVAALIQLPTEPVGGSDVRGGPSGTWAPEFQTYYVKNATLTRIIAESDEDYHLVLQDPTTTTSTMIGEIPCPNCASGGRFACNITHSRGALEAKFGSPPTLSGTSVVSVIGVGMYDPPHGQTGRAPNNLELHPVIAICFTQDCDPTAN